MKANREDAPSHGRYKKNEIVRLGLALVFGSAITATTLFIGSKLLEYETTPLAPVPTEPYVPKYDFSEAPKISGPTPEEQFWSDQNQRQQPKQTIYNDSNYTPRGAVNVVSIEGIRQSSAYQSSGKQKSQPRQRTIEHDQQTFSGWDGSKPYTATWTVINNRIDGSTVCENYKRGSIKYRECRKGAKQFFREQCRSDKQDPRLKERYCSAANSFSPMG